MSAVGNVIPPNHEKQRHQLSYIPLHSLKKLPKSASWLHISSENPEDNDANKTAGKQNQSLKCEISSKFRPSIEYQNPTKEYENEEPNNSTFLSWFWDHAWYFGPVIAVLLLIITG